MLQEELDQVFKIDTKFKEIEEFSFENKLREIVSECIGPLRERVIQNHEDISNMTKDFVRQAHKIDQLEIVYFNRENCDSEDSENEKPISIFDTINNKIADNMA